MSEWKGNQGETLAAFKQVWPWETQPHSNLDIVIHSNGKYCHLSANTYSSPSARDCHLDVQQSSPILQALYQMNPLFPFSPSQRSTSAVLPHSVTSYLLGSKLPNLLWLLLSSVNHSQLGTKFCWFDLLPFFSPVSWSSSLLLTLDQPICISLDHFSGSLIGLSILGFSLLHFIFPKHTQICHVLASKPPMAPDASKIKLKHPRLTFEAFRGLRPICSLNFPFIHSMLHPNWKAVNLYKVCVFLTIHHLTPQSLYFLDPNPTILARFKEQFKRHFRPWSFPSGSYHSQLCIPMAFSSPTAPIPFFLVL